MRPGSGRVVAYDRPAMLDHVAAWGLGGRSGAVRGLSVVGGGRPSGTTRGLHGCTRSSTWA